VSALHGRVAAFSGGEYNSDLLNGRREIDRGALLLAVFEKGRTPRFSSPRHLVTLTIFYALETSGPAGLSTPKSRRQSQPYGRPKRSVIAAVLASQAWFKQGSLKPPSMVLSREK
jgi:hypothetical protein